MFCPKCGAKIEKEDKFCEECGNEIFSSYKGISGIFQKKKTLVVVISILAIVIGTVVTIGIIAKPFNRIEKQPIGSSYAELSEIVSYMEKSWGIYYDELDWCRFYDVKDPESDIIFVQYKEVKQDDFSYAVFAYDIDLDHFYSYRYYEDGVLPQKIKVGQTNDTDKKNKVFQFTYNDSDYGYFICDKYGYIVRIAVPYWGGESEKWSLFDFEFDTQKNIICRTEYIANFSDVDNLDYYATSEEIDKFRYDDNGNLLELLEYTDNQEKYKTTTFYYNEKGQRIRTKQTKSYNDDEKSLVFQRDKNGLVTSASCTSYDSHWKKNDEQGYSITYLPNGLQEISD